MKKILIRCNEGSARPAHADRIERWLGKQKAEDLSHACRNWYGPPIPVLDVPGVAVAAGGDFVGNFKGGGFANIRDAYREFAKRFLTELGRPRYGYANAGFASLSDALSRASLGYSQLLGGGTILKNGPTAVVGAHSSLWRVGAAPAAGSIGAAAPGGTAYVDSTTGGLLFTNPATGTLHLQDGEMASSVADCTLLLHDRLFAVAKTMNSSATESVTGVPTRYQSSTSTNADYAGGNFITPIVGGTVLAATAHNHTVVQYRNQAGTDSQSAPSAAGRSAAAVDTVDLALNAGWFMPLNTGDVGAMDLAQIQHSAAVATGTMEYMIGHPLAFLGFPVAGSFRFFDWLTFSRPLVPRILDDACLSFLELNRRTTTASVYQGTLNALNAAP